MADGKVTIETEVDIKGAEKDLKNLEKNAKSAFSSVEASEKKVTNETEKMTSAVKKTSTVTNKATKDSTSLGNAQRILASNTEKANWAQKQEEKALSGATTALQKHKDNLEKLKTAYVNSYVAKGKDSEETKKYGRLIEGLSQNISKQERAMNEAKKSADALDKSQENLSKSTKKAGDEAKTSSGKFLSMAKSMGGAVIKGVVAGVTVASAAVAGLVAKSVKAYSTYEQLVGGVETLFGAQGKTLEEYAQFTGKTVDEVKDKYKDLQEAESTVMKNAAEAYSTAGLSANAYMEQITGFSASLVQSLEGDTVKAAEVGNRAIIDMSDNANKMGTDITMIQNAYQGFAKQNYTMLDNLKLGYGGTKAEMERLVSDASKMTNIQDKLNVTVKEGSLDFANIINAISVMQTSLGIAGTTADEAATTIEGSTNAMKAAWENLLVGMADDTQDFDKLIDNFVSSVDTWSQNILPRVQIALNGVSKLIEKLLPQIAKKIPEIINDNLPNLIQAGVSIMDALIQGLDESLPTLLDTLDKSVSQLINGIAKAGPQLVKAVVQIVGSLIQTLVKNAGNIANAALQMFTALLEGLQEALPAIIGEIPNLVSSIANAILDNVDLILQAGLDLMLALANGIFQALPDLLKKLPQIIEKMVDKLLSMVPQIIQCGIELLTSLVDALPDIISTIVEVLPEIINSIISTLLDHLPEIIECGVQLLVALIENLPQIILTIAEALPQIISGIITELLNHIPEIIACGIELLVAIIGNMPAIIEAIVKALPEIITAIVATLGAGVDALWQVGVNLITALWGGMKSLSADISSWAKSFVKNLFVTDVNLPTGKSLSTGKVTNKIKARKHAKGGVVGRGEIAFLEGDGAEAVVPLDQNHRWISKVASDMVNTLYTQNSNMLTATSNAPDVNVTVSLEGESEALFRAMQKQDKIYKRSNGRSAFAT